MLSIVESMDELQQLPEGKVLINTVNAHSFNTAQKDSLFADALMKGDALIPDGISIVKACGWLKAKSQPKERIAGWDLFFYEMDKLNKKGGKCFFMGSSEKCAFYDKNTCGNRLSGHQGRDLFTAI